MWHNIRRTVMVYSVGILQKSGRQNFNFDITGLHLLSNSEMAIFMEHEIWIATMQPGSGDIANLYYYNKSKLPIGIRQGSDVMTTFDGRYILFFLRTRSCGTPVSTIF